MLPSPPPFDPPPPTLVERLIAPFQRFVRVSSASGVVLLAATVVALAWANSSWAHDYHAVWDFPLSIGSGKWAAQGSLHQLINDGLMAVFFFLVGLEIKREILAGELGTLRGAALPMFAALGGMIVPAMLYAVIAGAGAAARGWGIPMATDIAFALGVLALLGSRVPIGLKIFLTALAIVDDIGAIVVIAVFYSRGVAWDALGAAAAIVLLAAGANRAGVRHPLVYAAIGIALWAAVVAGGVHGSIAGVLLAMTIPARMLASLERSLHSVVAFGIMPLFALSNAGVSLSSDAMHAAMGSPVTTGVALGLLVGKPIGIVAFAWLAVRLGLATLPSGVSWRMLAAAGVLGGIGFTMSLFIAALAFPDAVVLDAAKVGVLGASCVAGATGWLLLRLATRLPAQA